MRLNAAIRWGGDREFRPQVAEWEAIERAYGHPLAPAARDDITVAMETYLRDQPSEVTAPFADDADRYLTKIEKAGRRFFDVLMEGLNTPLSGPGDNQFIAEDDTIRAAAVQLIQGHLSKRLKAHPRSRMNWGGFLDVMSAYMLAAANVRAIDLDHAISAGFVEGHAWNRLVDELTQTSDRHGLPRGAAKVTDGRRPSGFVALVRELQALIPPEARRHEHSDVALTEGITVARRAVKQWRAKAARKINPAPAAD